ncbi:tyrosinase [Coprinopsis sp. MPI-PUGE-AT-0042]|nr:tyrosinase [Coprinopsis sp. MPI-PUGE-AT-0042]
MPDPTYPITGIKAGRIANPQSWGPREIVPVRVEADDFYTDEKYAVQRDLLYNAMAAFQHIPYSDMLSYFQVAGVHGMPHVPWDEPGMYHPQYCEHGTLIFGSWHRPYMLLFEQRLYEIMVNDIIPKYPVDKQAAMKAQADITRLPYWDWALKKNRTQDGKPVLAYDVPLIVKEKEVEVSVPEGGTRKIPNPFYNFKADDAMGEYAITALQCSDDGEPYESIPFDRARTTSRFEADPNLDPDVMAAFISAEGINELEGIAKDITEAKWYMKGAPDYKLAEAVNRLLAPGWFDEYRQFVTTSRAEAQQDGKYWLSLEGIHNNIHNWTGRGFGHMANVPVAGFDPIFYMHHANVDRLLAIWTQLNPKKWWTETEIIGKNGEVVRKMKPSDPLKPFHRNTTAGFWSPDLCRHHFHLGYTYPELQPWNFVNEKEYQAYINTTVSKLYAPPVNTQLAMSNHDVVVNVSFEKFALGGVPFTVRVYLAGEPVGDVYNFSFVAESRLGTSTCENCQNQQATNAVVTGQVFVTEELIKAVKDSNKAIKDLSQEEIAAYVKANLSWKVLRVNGKEANIPSLEVTPFIGRRQLHYVPKSTADEHEGVIPTHGPLEGGVIALPGVEIVHLPYLDGKWGDDMKTIHVHAPESNSSYTVRLGAWDAYEPL